MVILFEIYSHDVDWDVSFQLHVKITVPDNIVILDSVGTTSKEFEALQKQNKKKKNPAAGDEDEEDSDAEEERLIEEAENERSKQSDALASDKS